MHLARIDLFVKWLNMTDMGEQNASDRWSQAQTVDHGWRPFPHFFRPKYIEPLKMA
jgi:hypothetical protein